MSRSLDQVNWWEPEHWKTRPRCVSSAVLQGADPSSIRNGWLTLPDQKVISIIFLLYSVQQKFYNLQQYSYIFWFRTTVFGTPGLNFSQITYFLAFCGFFLSLNPFFILNKYQKCFSFNIYGSKNIFHKTLYNDYMLNEIITLLHIWVGLM